MTERLSRNFAAELEVRSTADGRTVTGIAAPFDAPTRITGEGFPFDEVIRKGAFARTIAERGDRVKFLAAHNAETLPLGRASLLREDRAGLYAEFRVSKTERGDEVLELIRDGALDSLSIGFQVVSDRWDNSKVPDLRELLEVKLFEVSAVTFPAYDGARITAVRYEPSLPLSTPTALLRRRLRLF